MLAGKPFWTCPECEIQRMWPPEGAQELATRIVAALTLHCEREHMTIGERECCREIVRAELAALSGSAGRP